MSSTQATNPNLAERIMIVALIYYTPALICLGSIGNALSVWVLSRAEMRRSSSSFYLAALAISDTGFLISVLIPLWLEIFGVHIFDRKNFCPFFIYFTTLWSFLSVWLVVAFTVERFVAVRFPLRRQSMCTVARAKTILGVLSCLGPLLCCPVLWMATPTDSVWSVPACSVIEEWESWAFVFVIANTVVTFVLPFAVIAVLNGLIVTAVRSQIGLRRTLTNSTMASSSNETSAGQQGSSGSSSQTKITKMLLTVSSTFLFLNLPSYAMRVYAFCQVEEMPGTLMLIQHICDLVFDTSFGINFFLYCASGHNFRQAVLHTMVCCPEKLRASQFRLSFRSSQRDASTKSTTSSGSCLTPQHTIVRKIPSDANHEF